MTDGQIMAKVLVYYMTTMSQQGNEHFASQLPKLDDDCLFDAIGNYLDTIDDVNDSNFSEHFQTIHAMFQKNFVIYG